MIFLNKSPLSSQNSLESGVISDGTEQESEQKPEQESEQESEQKSAEQSEQERPEAGTE